MMQNNILKTIPLPHSFYIQKLTKNKKKMQDYKLKSGNILRVEQDEFAESPDTWGDKSIFLVYDHRSFTVEREGFAPRDIFDSLNDSECDDFDGYYIFQVDAHIHSGVSLSLSTKTSSRGWDVSNTGYVVIDKNVYSEEIAKKCAEGLLETWNSYLSGGVYSFLVMKPLKTYEINENNLEKFFQKGILDKTAFMEMCSEEIDYEIVDSCGGFYGSNPLENGMIDHIDDEIVD